jgi:hypothetical protein
MKDRTKPHVVMNLSQDSMTVDGIWPGMVGSIAVVVFGLGGASPTSERFNRLVKILSDMRKKGGQEPTRRLKNYLVEYGYDTVFEPTKMGIDEFADGRQFFRRLLQYTLAQIKSEGEIRRRPFFLSSAMLDQEMQNYLQNTPGI